MLVHGFLDGLGHLLTAGIVAIGIASWGRGSIPLWSVLAGGVAPDIGHILALLNIAEPIDGSSRNGSHSLFVVAIVLGLALIDRSRRSMWLGISIGAATHLWRDMGTGTIPLLWPWSQLVFEVNVRWYIAGTAIVGLILILIGTIIGTGDTKRTHDRETRQGH